MVTLERGPRDLDLAKSCDGRPFISVGCRRVSGRSPSLPRKSGLPSSRSRSRDTACPSSRDSDVSEGVARR